MRLAHRSACVLATLVVVAGCAATGDSSTAPASTPAAPVSTSAPTTAPTPTVAHAPTTVPTVAPTPVPTEAGPIVLASTLYPYRVTVPSGPTSFVPARVPWDGVQSLGTASVTLDHARAPGVSLVFLAMTDTALGVDGFAAQMEDRMRAWHGCTPADGRRSFDVGDLRGVGFTQLCGIGDAYARAVLVGDGHALFAFAHVGLDAKASLGGLIDFLSGVEWTAT